MENQRMTNTVTLVSILDALLARQFDRMSAVSGTDSAVISALAPDAKGDGKVDAPAPDNRMPFATVCEPADLEAMKKIIFM
jgi:hypothetical protein